MRRLDHSMIFVLIAGTYTPVRAARAHGTWRIVMLAIVWGGALGGVVLKLVWIDAPKWLTAAIVYVALGWVGVVVFAELLHAIGGLGVGAARWPAASLYTVGAVIYALRRPEPAAGAFSASTRSSTLS